MAKNGYGQFRTKPGKGNGPVSLKVTILDMIPKSRSVKITTTGKDEHFMPLQECSFHSNDDGTFTMTCPAWMAKQKGLTT